MRIAGWAAALVAMLALPSFALAAGAPTVTKESREKGMAAAPALVKDAGSDCQVSDARFVGEATDPKTKAKTALYEVACTGGEGLLVQQVSTDPKASLFTCMEAAGAAAAGNKTATQCVLPGNADPQAGILPYVQKSGVHCAPDKIRPMGHSSTNVFFELSCKEGPPGYILQISEPPSLSQPESAESCLMFDPNSAVHCELTDRAAQMSVIDNLVKQSGKPCAVKDRGFIGVAGSGSTYYEVSCQDGKGYMLQTDAKGAFTKAIDCVDADVIAGGCKLTDTRQAKTEQNSLYSSLAKKAGFDCNVSGYAPFEASAPGKEIVELSCSNRPDGAIAEFPVTGSAPGVIYDCAHSELMSFRCTLTKPETAYPKLTADLKTLGKNTCTVSAARVVGVTPDQHGYIEVGCSDGLPGYMIEYSLSPITPKSPLVCAEAKGIGGGCSLPHNKS
ncbi:MAG TPA: hypothetical protein VGG68_03610 [Caulobacteraceae bacterium]|jgi:hypothetical protein